MTFLGVIGDIAHGFSSIANWITDTISNIGNIFDDIDFTILYDWLPTDIQAVITACIAFLFVLALFGLLRRLLFFLG